jgi:hypothetical protein
VTTTNPGVSATNWTVPLSSQDLNAQMLKMLTNTFSKLSTVLMDNKATELKLKSPRDLILVSSYHGTTISITLAGVV